MVNVTLPQEHFSMHCCAFVVFIKKDPLIWHPIPVFGF